MPDKNEKSRRKDLLRSQQEDQRRSVREGLPVAQFMMTVLFDHIDKQLSLSECD
jgi:hypothetical protein